MNTPIILFRQDPALRVLPRAVATALGLGLLFRIEPDLALGLATLDADDLPGGFGPMYLVAMGLVMTFVLSANAWTRASRLSVSLPLPTRLTWLMRTTSLVAVVVGAIVSTVLILGLSLGPDGLRINPVIALAALRATATALLLILLYQLPLADRDRIPITAEYVIYVIFITLFIVPFSAAGITSIAGSVFFFTVAFCLGAWLWIRTPRAWSVGPSVAEAEEPAWSSREPENDQRTAGFLEWEAPNGPTQKVFLVHWTVFRGLTNFLPKWLILIGMAGAVTIVTLEFFDGTNAFLALVLVTVWHLPVLQTSLERMTSFDPLPISRRALWAHTIGPAVVAILIGFLTAQLIYRINPSKWSPIHFTSCCVEVPWEYLEIARDGASPPVTAPWGETLTPKTSTLWRGLPAALYDPYEVTPESSPRFVEFQQNRAFAAVYGPDLTPSTANGARSDRRSRFAAITLLLATLLVFSLMAPALWQYGPSTHRRIFKWASWGTLIFLGVMVVALAAARLAAFTEVWYVGAVVSIGIRHMADWIPVSTRILWISVVTFWFGSYLLLGGIFKRIELPGRNIVNRFAEEY